MDRLLEQLITEAARGLEEAEGFGTAEQMDFTGFRGRVERMDDLLIAALFPQHAGQLKSLNIPARLAREQYLHEAMGHLKRCLEAVLPENEAEQERIVHVMLASLPEIRRKLGTDLVAAYQGDPAAKSADEVILCYPAFIAISTYRLAHVLYTEKVPLIPRVMTEYAHRLTGIDIHPGATIGDYFFIDHGTGVVIGETTTCRRGGRQSRQGHQAPSGHRRQRGHLLRRHRPGRQDPYRQRLRHRRQRMAHPFGGGG